MVEGISVQVLVSFGNAACHFPFLEQCSKEQPPKQPSEGAGFFLAWAMGLSNNNKDIFIKKIKNTSTPSGKGDPHSPTASAPEQTSPTWARSRDSCALGSGCAFPMLTKLCEVKRKLREPSACPLGTPNGSRSGREHGVLWTVHRGARRRQKERQ